MEDSRRQIPEISRWSTTVVVDLETTGLDPRRHSILEIGAAALRDQALTFECECRMREGAEWDPGAAAVHGKTFEASQNPALPTEAEAIELLEAWLLFNFGETRIILAGMNPRFDLDFLKGSSARNEPDRLARRFSHRTIDLHTAAAMGTTADIEGLYTDGIYKALGMEPEPKPHRALTGATKERAALERLIHG